MWDHDSNVPLINASSFKDSLKKWTHDLIVDGPDDWYCVVRRTSMAS